LLRAAPGEAFTVIRQAISCDICGTEKRQTNHWFVAYEQGGELRVSGWTSRHRLRADSKHLCGQTCLHKLVDEFMARSIAARAKPSATDVDCELDAPAISAATLAAAASESEAESSARLLTPPEPAPARDSFPLRPESAPIAARHSIEEFAPPSGDAPRYVSRAWRAEAWERERERELRAIENRPDIASRRRSDA
jgi:hypothetical protein